MPNIRWFQTLVHLPIGAFPNVRHKHHGYHNNNYNHNDHHHYYDDNYIVLNFDAHRRADRHRRHDYSQRNHSSVND